MFIYLLRDPFGNRIRYVGFTKRSLPDRLKTHIKDANRRRDDGSWYFRNYRVNWIRYLQEHHRSPTIELIEVVNKENWQEREKFWIKEYRKTCLLVNHTDGGEGVLGHVKTEAQLLKASAAIKKSWQVPKTRAARLNGLKDPEMIKRRNESIKLAYAQPELASRAGKHLHSPENKAKRLVGIRKACELGIVGRPKNYTQEQLESALEEYVNRPKINKSCLRCIAKRNGLSPLSLSEQLKRNGIEVSRGMQLCSDPSHVVKHRIK